MAGLMVVSLDFELLWGMRDHIDLQHPYIKQIEKTDFVALELLKIFNNYNIHATWATVGMALTENLQELLSIVPTEKPSYDDKSLSGYNYLSEYDDTDFSNKLYSAAKLANKICDTQNQELASHTFSHYYCLEPGQDIKQFEADIQSAILAAKKYNKKIYSIVFPRNQVKPEYIGVLKKYNIVAYRGCSDGFAYQAANKDSNTFFNRLCRILDTYTNIFGMKCYSTDHMLENGIVNIKASRFFRPYMQKLSFFEPLKILAIKCQMKYAAKNNLCFHLWWHPHNFAGNTENSFKQLEQLLKYYKKLEIQYSFKSLNMKELAQEILK